MYYTEEPQKKIAGMLSMHVDTMVPKLARSYQDVACQMNERKVNIYLCTNVNNLIKIARLHRICYIFQLVISEKIHFLTKTTDFFCFLIKILRCNFQRPQSIERNAFLL